MARIQKRYACVQDDEDWPEANQCAISEDDATFYNRMRSAILQYRSGASAATILRTTGVQRSHLAYWLERCSALDQDGRPLRWLALARHQRIGERNDSVDKLNSAKPLSGVLHALFRANPALKRDMIDLVLENKIPGTKLTAKRMAWPEKHEYFLQSLPADHKPPAWPFNSPDKGFNALKSWGKKLAAKHEQLNSLAAQLKRKADAWWRKLLPTTRAYERVECDGHFIDVNWKVTLKSPNGEGDVVLVVTRLWLIALIETVSSAVIGYAIAYGKNYSAADMCRAVRSSLIPWQPRRLTVSTIDYRPGECLPNALVPELAYVCFDQLWLDNAWSHLAKLFTSTLANVVNAIPVFGPKAAPNVRPRAEGLFDLLEEAGFHPTQGTTGSNPRDPRRAQESDTPYMLDHELILDLTDILICRYNASKRPGTTISRLETLRRVVTRETTVLRRVPISRRSDLLKYDTYEIREIGRDKGRPLVRWQNARYYGEGLLSEPHLIGKEVLVMGNSLDARYIEVVLIGSGKSLGVLTVEDRWSQTAHSLMARAEIRRVMTNEPFLRVTADIPKAFREHLQNKRRLDAKESRLLARLALEQAATSAAGLQDQTSKPQEKVQEDRATSQSAGFPSAIQDTETSSQHSEQHDDGDAARQIARGKLDEILKSIGSVYRNSDE